MNLSIVNMTEHEAKYHTGIWFTFTFPKEKDGSVKFGYARVVDGKFTLSQDLFRKL